MAVSLYDHSISFELGCRRFISDSIVASVPPSDSAAPASSAAATFGTDAPLMLRSRGIFEGATHVPKFNKFHLYRPQLHPR